VHADGQLGSSDPHASDELFLGDTWGIARLGDTLFVADRDQNVVLVADLLTGRFVDSFGSSGEGPGEFGRSEAVLVSADRIYVLDSRRRGVHLFDHSYQELDFLRTGGFSFSNGFALAGDDLIVRTPRGADRLFEVRNRVPPYAREGSLGRPVPRRFPSTFGNIQALVAANSRGHIAFAWYGLPVVVVYDSNLEATGLI